jgi:signal transduction histidine kinase
VSVLGIGYLDLITDYEYSMALLYLVPVAMTATRAVLRWTLAMVVYAAATWFLADYLAIASPMPRQSALSLVWIGLIRLGTLAVVGVVVLRNQRTLQKLRAAIAELEAFSHSLAHDMRAPLRAMRSYAEILIREQSPALEKTPGRDYLQRIVSACARMDTLILDMLEYSRLARGEVPLEPVDAGALVRRMVASYPNLQAHQSGIHLEGEFPLLLANKAALVQCVSNLLGNAVKFVAPGTTPQVRVWAEKRDRTVRLWFEDNGIGIEKGSERRIFQLFQRLNAGYEGTGVGLGIVRKAVERMGGEVGVESEPGQGSRFWLQLKAADKHYEPSPLHPLRRRR